MPRCGRLRLGTRVMSRSNSRMEPLSGLDHQVDILGDAQAAEGFAKHVDAERAHRLSSLTAETTSGLRRACNACQPIRHSRTEPGTSPSGMKLMMATKMTPSTRFQ